MSALRKAQFEHDEQLPPPVSETAQEVAREEWLHNAVEQLLLGCDVKFQRRMRKAQGVTVAELEAAGACRQHVRTSAGRSTNDRWLPCLSVNHPS